MNLIQIGHFCNLIKSIFNRKLIFRYENIKYLYLLVLHKMKKFDRDTVYASILSEMQNGEIPLIPKEVGDEIEYVTTSGPLKVVRNTEYNTSKLSNLESGPSYLYKKPLAKKQIFKQSWADMADEDEKKVIKSNFPTYIDILTGESYERLKELLRSPTTYEIEAGFGVFKLSRKHPNSYDFQPGILSREIFENSLNYFLNQKESWAHDISKYKIENDWKTKIRRKTDNDGSVIYQEKIRDFHNSIEIQDWGIRITKSKETSLQNAPNNFNPGHVREITRHTFIQTDERSSYYGYKIDFSIVRETKLDQRGSRTYNKFEIEIEKIASTPNSVDNFRNLLILVLNSLSSLGTNLLLDQILSLNEKQYVTKEHNKLFQGQITQRNLHLDQNNMFKNYQNKPVSLKTITLLDTQFRKSVNTSSGVYNFPAVTTKYDGTRKFLLIIQSGCYMIFAPNFIIKIANPVNEVSLLNTLIDGEYMENGFGANRNPIFFSFDILYHNNIDYQQARFPERIKILSSIEKQLETHFANNGFNMLYKQKEYYMTDNFYKNVELALQNADQYPEHSDGIILQPEIWYKNGHTFKWKPSSKLTIDFLIKKVGDAYILLSFGSESKDDRKMHKFEGTYAHPYSGEFKYSSFDGEDVNDKIIECTWDYENNTFKPYRFRADRDAPNHTKVAKEIWHEMQSPITRETLEGKNLILLRKFHNEIKKDFLLRTFKQGDIILDIGSGRGGDLLKWKELKLKKVYVVEPDKDNVKELLSRKKHLYQHDNDPEIVIINHGVQETKEIIEAISPNDKLAGVVAFFSLTYMMRNEETFDGFIDTLTTILPEGGRFIGIVLEGKEVQKKLIASNNLINNQSFSIIPNFDDGKPQFGNEITISINDETSMVKDQTEWLFYSSILQSKLRGYGFITDGYNLLNNETPSKVLNDKFNLLSDDSQLFSSMNQAFFMSRKEKKNPEAKVNARKPKVIKIEPLLEPNSKEQYIFATNEQPIHKFERMAVPVSIFNPIVAFLMAISKRLDDLPGKKQKNFAKEVLSNLYKKFDKEKYNDFPKKLKNKLKYPVIEEYLKNGGEPLPNIYLLAILSKIFNVNVLLFSNEGSFETQADLLCNISPKKKVILLVRHINDGVEHYEYMQIDGERIVEADKVQYMIDDLCK
jgi:hypothetical protein